MNTLLKLGANIYTSNKYGDNPLHSAVRTNNLELVRYLIMNGGDINHKNRLNETPLYLAVSKPEKDIKIITILVDSGSDIFHIVKKKETDDYGEETEKEITMMKKMLDKDSSDKALEIQTYLIRKVHDYYRVTMMDITILLINIQNTLLMKCLRMPKNINHHKRLM